MPFDEAQAKQMGPLVPQGRPQAARPHARRNFQE